MGMYSVWARIHLRVSWTPWASEVLRWPFCAGRKFWASWGHVAAGAHLCGGGGSWRAAFLDPIFSPAFPTRGLTFPRCGNGSDGTIRDAFGVAHQDRKAGKAEP